MRRPRTRPADIEPASKKALVAAPNPYALAVATALLAAVLSVAGGYFTAGFQARHAVAQKQLEFKVGTYTAFLERIDHTKAPLLNAFLNVGRLLDMKGKTDGEIQISEDQLESLLRKSNLIDISLTLNSYFATLKLHGSKQVSKICDDILTELISGDENVDWSDYSQEARAYHSKWKQLQQDGIAYGWVPKISNEDRLMIHSVSKLMSLLNTQLRSEIATTGT